MFIWLQISSIGFSSLWYGGSLQTVTPLCSAISSTTHEVYSFLTLSTVCSYSRFKESSGSGIFFANSHCLISSFPHAVEGNNSDLRLWYAALSVTVTLPGRMSDSSWSWSHFSNLSLSVSSRQSAEFSFARNANFASLINPFFHLHEQSQISGHVLSDVSAPPWGRPGRRPYAFVIVL
jgi:hypothetical protein